MNESLDLRNRILKMRESNKLVLDQVKLESKTTNTYSEIIAQEPQNNLNSLEENIKTKLEKDNFINETKKIENSNYLKRKSTNSKSKNDESSNKQNLANSAYGNEAQFRIIAKKFNEAVEVILELSDKVKNLEEIVQSLSIKPSKDKKSNYFFNFKTFILIVLTTLILVGLYTYPIDLTLFNLVISDVISSI